ncbi:hypothetical protein MKX01_002793 [Papaver californicum]|nr:hypothetical protein MKX01_002793 [Papaver californicum]
MMSGKICQSSIGEHEVEENESSRQENDSRSESNNEDHTVNRFQLYIIIMYEVAEIYKHNVLKKANIYWINWKHHLRLELDKYDTIADRKRNMSECLIAKREDCESFVYFCNTDEDRTCRVAGKKAREAVELLQSCSSKGISRTIHDLKKESTTGEINRCIVFTKTHVTKTISDPESTFASDIKIRKIKELVDADPNGHNDIDVAAQVVEVVEVVKEQLQRHCQPVGLLVEEVESWHLCWLETHALEKMVQLVE